MSLLDELRAKPGKTCVVCAFLGTRDVKERAEWAEAFKDRSISCATIHRAMKARDFGYSESPVSNHRRGGHVAH